VRAERALVDEPLTSMPQTDFLEIKPESARRLVVGPLEIDVDGHRVVVMGRRVPVSALQMRLLIYLVERRDRVVSRAELLQQVWGYSVAVHTRTIDVHVQRLRGKLGVAAGLIATVRGVGYRLSVDPD
jgi:two-component system, OmpR family, phosphate regulon response regulator PhoB